MSKHIPPEHIEAMVSAYLAGATLKQAAARFGYAASSCARALQKQGVVSRGAEAKRHVLPEDEAAMIKAYQSGASTRQIATQFGYSQTACRIVLRRNDLKTRNPLEAAKRIPAEHEAAMIAAYQSGMSLEKTAAMYGHSGRTCLYVLQRNGITSRSLSEAGRVYSIDENFFDVLDTEAKAYWLGFLTADGNVSGNAIQLKLKADDIAHLNKFVNDLKAEHPIYFVSRQDSKGNVRSYAAIRINSKKLAAALFHLGVGERKSFTVQPCYQLPQELLAAYWRGVFDGDGCIGYFGKRKPIWKMVLVGNEFIVTGFRNFITQFVASSAAVRPEGKIFRINYGGLGISRTIARLLYDNATVYLDRKYALAQRLLTESE